MKLRMAALLAICIMISSVSSAPNIGDLKSNENYEYSSCEKAADILNSDIEPAMDYANTLYYKCDCFEKMSDAVKAGECYDKVMTSCDKILDEDQSQVSAVNLKCDAMDRLNNIHGTLFGPPPSSGCTCIRNSSYDSIIAGYNRVIELNSRNIVAWNNRGIIYGELCCLNESVRSFDEAIRINGSLAEPWYNKGISLYWYNPEEALKCFNRSIKLDPNLAEAWYNKHVLLLPETIDRNDPVSRRAYEESLASYHRSLELSPELGNYIGPYLVYKKMH